MADDVELYADRTWQLLAEHPIENTIALTVIEEVRAGRRWSDEPMLFGWYYHDSHVYGAVSMTPPYELHLAVVPYRSVDELAAELRVRKVCVPGVHGDAKIVDRFAAAWITGTSLHAMTTMHQRLYVLTRLSSPTPSPPGWARQARNDDIGVATQSLRAFYEETGVTVVDPEPIVRAWIANGLLWLWQEPTGSVVSLAGRNATVAGVARIAFVYTPPSNRRHGYGAAVAAACTSDALRCDANHVVLFTDLANPTSNAIYQRIGYQPFGDRTVVTFRK